MIGRTNVIFGSRSGSGGSGSGMVDLPTHPDSIAILAGDQCATLTLGYTNTDYISGVRVCYKIGSYPTNATDGDFLDTESAAASIQITGLTNSVTYYFRVFLYNEVDSTKYFQSDITNAKISAMPNSVWVEGITPAESGSNYIVIAESGTFTLHGNSSVIAYLVGGGYNGDKAYQETDDDGTTHKYGGSGGKGGYVFSKLLSEITNDTVLTCVGTIGATNGGTTKIQIGSITTSSSSGTYLRGGVGASTTVSSTKGKNGVLTPYGYVGSSGGGGGYTYGATTYDNGSSGGEGAGSGTKLGVGTNATNYGCGGGGGAYYGSYSDYFKKGGTGMPGCIIFTWTN